MYNRILNENWLKFIKYTNIRAFLSRPLVWDTITTSFLSVLSKGVGFLVPFFIAAWFGVTSETDAFFFTYGLILFLSGIFAVVVESVIVPYIAEARTRKEDVGKFTGKLICLSGFYLLLLVLFTLLIIKPILSVLTNFDSIGLNLIHKLFIEISPLVILLVWTSILAGTLNAYKKFSIPALSPAFRAIVNLCVIFITKEKFGIHSITLGYIAGEIVRFVVLSCFAVKMSVLKVNLSLKLQSKIREFFHTSFYQIVGMTVIGLSPIIGKTMSSWLGGGSVSILHYANLLYMIPVTFASSGLMVTLLSHWSNRYYETSKQRLRTDVNRTIKVVGLLSFMMTIFLICFNKQIVYLAFGRGEFSQEKIDEVSLVWVCYLLGLIPYIIQIVFVQAHLTLKNTKVLMRGAFWAIILNTLLNYLLMKSFKIAGIAFATTLMSIFLLAYLGHAFYKNSDE